MRMDKFAFPQTLLSSKICGFALRELEIAQRNAYFLQLSKIVVPLLIGTSPLRAERSAGLESALRRKPQNQ
jgi:hypothetical protein